MVKFARGKRSYSGRLRIRWIAPCLRCSRVDPFGTISPLHLAGKPSGFLFIAGFAKTAVMKLRFGLAFLCLLLSFAAHGDGVKLPKKKELHIYLLMGQSNMAGRGIIEEVDKTPHPRVLRLNYSNQWEVAIEPITEDRAPKLLGVGPGLAFGKIMAEENKKATIALVPCAVGGTPLSRWSRGGDLYSNALVRAKLAMRDGTLKGILWHQGENDSLKLETAETYEDRLAQMITHIREDLNAPNLPVVVAQIGEFLYTRKDPTKTPHARMINDALERIPSRVLYTACVFSAGLTHKGDEVHFDARSEREMGRRFAEQMLKLQKKKR
ncbi:MAG: sialate O-acetylesterase, partial [Limisphaerales bacterium]